MNTSDSMKKLLWSGVVLLGFMTPGFCRERPVRLSVPLSTFSHPSSRSFHIPSMPQSMQWTKSFYQGAHALIDRAFADSDYDNIQLAAELLFDLVSLYLPLGDSWLHEEWHRAVLAYHDISSFNEVYLFRVLSPVIAVSRVADDDLIRLKANNPADMIRLHEAGMEGQYAHLNSLSRERFFLNENPYARIFNIAITANSIAYVLLSATPYSNQVTETLQNKNDGSMRNRDFTGWDFTAWVYDLFRPAEPYPARGVHPTGIGIDRSITTGDLTTPEIRYLRLQGILSILNLLDPHLYNFPDVMLGVTRMQWYLRHLLTSFGSTTDLTTLWRIDHYNLALTLHNQANRIRYYPGLTLELYEFPLFAKKKPHNGFITLATTLSLQPRRRLFQTSESELVFAVEGTFRGFWTRHTGWFVAGGYKSAGWVMGYPTVQAMGRLSTGIQLRLGGEGG